jgi:enoyl-CoA hydratase/carnithine racemase
MSTPVEGMSTPVETVANGRIWEVTLSSPPDNRLNVPTLLALEAALDRFEADPALHLLLLQGSKTTFSKGFDLSALGPSATSGELRRMLVLSNAFYSRLARCPKPTIAAISGACLGGGLELALCCHFRLSSDRARFGLPEIWIKLVPGLGGATRLCRIIGQAKALELAALGDLLSAEDALRVNLVNRVFPKAEFADRVKSFANALLMADVSALQEAIRLVSNDLQSDEEDGVRHSLDAFHRLARTWSPPQS